MPFAFEFSALLGLAVAVWYWLEAMRNKEIARAAGKRACQQAEVQFLDDTVEITTRRWRRDANGQIRMYREYRFEFSADGAARYRGAMALLGRRVVRLELESRRSTDRAPPNLAP
jgi:hypothetical protein